MGLQAILEKIRALGDVQVQEIEENAQSQVNVILAEARMEAHQLEEESCASASAPAAAERARILHRARLESLRIAGDVREDLVDTALAGAREHLASFCSDPSYPAVLHALIDEALGELALGGAGKAQLLADPRDRELVPSILSDLGLDLPVTYELNCWGGVIAKSEDGRVVVINTLESRLEQATVFLCRYLAAFFEEKQTVVKAMVHG